MSLSEEASKGVLACTSSRDSSQFALSMASGTLLVLNSANLKLKSVAYTADKVPLTRLEYITAQSSSDDAN